jgi:xylulose-5-phosphate/fructose-6-phosphate phosphoketolase
VVLPILHLNGYKIANPTVLARMNDQELTQFFSGHGWKPYFVEGDIPEEMHQLMAGRWMRSWPKFARFRNEPGSPAIPVCPCGR